MISTIFILKEVHGVADPKADFELKEQNQTMGMQPSQSPQNYIACPRKRRTVQKMHNVWMSTLPTEMSSEKSILEAPTFRSSESRAEIATGSLTADIFQFDDDAVYDGIMNQLEEERERSQRCYHLTLRFIYFLNAILAIWALYRLIFKKQ